LLERLPRGRRNAALALLGVLTLWFAWSIRAVLNPLLVGYLLAYILHPIVQRVRGRRLSHRGAVNLTFAVVAVGLVLVGVGLVHQTNSLVRDVITNDKMGELIRERWHGLHAKLDWLPDVTRPGRDTLAEDLQAGWETLRDWMQEDTAAATEAAQVGLRRAGDALDRVRAFAGWLLGVGGLVVLVPLYTYYLLFELERVHGFFRRYLPKRERTRIAAAGSQIGEVLANFFRGRLLVCLLKGGLLTLGLWLTGIPYAFLLGMGSGFLSLIPAVGPMVGFIAAFLLGALAGDHTFVASLVRTGVVFALAEVVEGYVLIPKVLGDSLGLHPVVVLFSLLAGGASLGLFGILVALPLTASIVIVVREFVLPALARFADEDRVQSSSVIVTGSEESERED
jgi:predicted PurR-regulated permease PerM